MKVNYLPKNKTRYHHPKRVIILIAIFIVGAATFSFLDATVISFASPAWKVENVIIRNLQNGIAFFNSRQKLVDENTDLREKVSSLELQISSLYAEQTQENNLLELMGRRQSPGAIAAAVLTRPPQTPYDTIIIDAGSNDSITLGAEVFLPEGPILGTVSEVFANKAKVKLFSSDGEETSALLERNSVPVTLVGLGGGNFKITLPQDTLIEREDKILSADISFRLLAIVGDIESKHTDSFKEVIAKSPTNIFILRFIFVAP